MKEIVAYFPLHFFRKNEAKNHRDSQIALLSKMFVTTERNNIAWLSPDA